MKLTHTATLAQDISSYHLLPDSLIYLVAVILPWVELICGGGALFGIWVESCVLALAGLSVILTLAVASALGRQLEIRCGCFNGDNQLTAGHLALNIILMALALALIVAKKANNESDSDSMKLIQASKPGGETT